MPARLRVIHQTPAPAKERVRQRIKSVPKHPALLECRCGSRSFIPEVTGAVLKDGKPTGGTRQMICAFCLAKGERVVVA